MTEKKKEEPAFWIIFGAGVVTVLMLATLLFLIDSRPDCDAGNGLFKQISCLTPNELGDLLAGAFAPLAFLWLMVAVLLQMFELRAQRQELELTRQEFEKQRDVMQSQSEYIGEQTLLLREEARIRLQSEAGKEFEAQLEVLAKILRDHPHALDCQIDGQRYDPGLMQGMGATSAYFLVQRFATAFPQWRDNKGVGEETSGSGEIYDRNGFLDIHCELCALMNIVGRLGPDRRIKAAALELEEFLVAIESFAEVDGDLTIPERPNHPLTGRLPTDGIRFPPDG